MASVTLTVTDVAQQNGRVYIRWSDGVEQEFASLADAIRLRDQLAERAVNLLRVLAVARYLRVDPTGSNPALIKGHSITVSDEQNIMVQVI